MKLPKDSPLRARTPEEYRRGYPQHYQHSAVEKEAEIILRFLQWAVRERLFVCKRVEVRNPKTDEVYDVYRPVGFYEPSDMVSFQKLIFAHFGLDYNAWMQEIDTAFEVLRAAQAEGFEEEEEESH